MTALEIGQGNPKWANICNRDEFFMQSPNDPTYSQPHPNPEHATEPHGSVPHGDGEPDAVALALTQVEAQNLELSEQYLRAKAEVENMRRRTEEEVAKVRKFATVEFAESLLAVIDSLEAGLVSQEASAQQIRQGAEATLKQLQAALTRNKVVAIAPQMGEKFDPHLHQAISMVAAQQEPNTVVTLLQKGYQMSERVLRPALVTVAASGS